MRLNPEPFELIKSGIKKAEVRLNDEKRKNIKIGDIIVFSKRPELKEKIEVKVIGRKEYSEYPTKYYSEEEQLRYGIVVFDIELLK